MFSYKNINIWVYKNIHFVLTYNLCLLKEYIRAWSHIPNQEPISKWQQLGKEKLDFANGVSLDIQITLTGWPLPAVQYRMNSMALLEIIISYCFVWAFFNLLIFSFYIMISGYVFYWSVCGGSVLFLSLLNSGYFSLNLPLTVCFIKSR